MSPKTLRTKEEWLSIISSWQASGKNAKNWCSEHAIPLNSLYTAYRRLFPSKGRPLTRSCFTEIKQAADPNIGIELNYRGAQVKLNSHFDEASLLRLLNVLERLPC
jgi:hypothetical protein